MANTIIRYDRTDTELEEFLFFCVAVAGKTGLVVKALVRKMFSELLDPNLEWPNNDAESDVRPDTPFKVLNALLDNSSLVLTLKRYKIGQYTKLVKFAKHITQANLDLRTCSLEDLMACPGVGPKTARFFLIYTRPNQKVAVLDVHILRHLRESGYPDAPETTPQNPSVYKKWEDIVLSIAEREGISPVDLDDTIWRARAWKPKE